VTAHALSLTDVDPLRRVWTGERLRGIVIPTT